MYYDLVQFLQMRFLELRGMSATVVKNAAFPAVFAWMLTAFSFFFVPII